MDLLAALHDAEKRLATAEKRRQELDTRIEELRAEKHGLDLAVARHRLETTQQGDTEQSPSQGAWINLHRTNAILQMLQREQRAMTPSELSSALISVGRKKDNPAYVSAALSYLKRNHRVRSEGQGRWSLNGAKPASPTVPLLASGPPDGGVFTNDPEERGEP